MLPLCASIGMLRGDILQLVNVSTKKKVPNHFSLCARIKTIHLMVLSPVVKGKVASRGFFNIPASRSYCILAPTSARIHFQRRHASYRCVRPLAAKAGTTPQFCQWVWIYKNPAGIFYMLQTWDMGHIILLPLQRKAYWGFFGCPKNPTALAWFEPANSASSDQYTNH
jgi:hypothetical protein